MNTMLIANLKNGWHKNLPNLTEDAHAILDEIDRIWFYQSESIIEAEDTLEAENYYAYIPWWDDSFDVAENFNALTKFCGLIRDLQLRAYPLTVEKSDIESFSSYTVSEATYHEFQNVDFGNIRINDVPAIIKLNKMIYN